MYNTVSHSPTTEQQLQNPEIANFMKFTKKTKLPEKFKFPNNRGFKPTEKRRAEGFLPLGRPPLIN